MVNLFLKIKRIAWWIMAVTMLVTVSACGLTDKTSKSSEEEIGVAKQLYEAQNPYIGDVSGDGALLRILWDYYQIQNIGTSELQTSNTPYWITIDFTKKPEERSMFKTAAVFLALVDNCGEFRWNYYDENERLTTCYVRARDVNEILGCEDIKQYGESEETVEKLLFELEEALAQKEEKDPIVKVSYWEQLAKQEELDSNTRKELECRLIRDGIDYRENYEVKDLVYQDFDKNGVMDFALLTTSEYDVSTPISLWYIYINEEPVFNEHINIYCFSLGIQAGDIDHDGNTELVYIADTGGNGGSGSYAKGILKYKEHSLEVMNLPGDFSEEETEWGDEGYHLEVSFAKGEGEYLVSCPAIGESKVIQSVYTVYEDGTLFQEPVEGEVVGAECRGYFGFSIVEKEGKEYLTAKEYFHGEGGINDGKGEATFLFDWNEEEGLFVKEFDVKAYPIEE